MRFGMRAESCLRQLYVNFGEDAFYMPIGKEPVSVLVIVEFGPEEIMEDTGVNVQSESRKINALSSEVVSPSKGDRFRVRGKDYKVVQIMPEDEGEREIYLEEVG